MRKSVRYKILIDFGGTHIKTGIMRSSELIDTAIIVPNLKWSFSSCLKQIEDFINGFLSKPEVDVAQVSGLGLALPGIVDFKDKTLISINEKYAEGIGYDFVGWSKQKFGLPIVVENDARAALIGEWKYGSGSGFENLVMMTLGTGVGTAAVIEGKVLRGKHFQAGCLGGHFTISTNGKLCSCGNIGCVEAEASSWSIQDMILRSENYQYSGFSKSKKIDFELAFKLYELGDPLAVKILRKCMNTWGSGIVNLIHAYDPELVILGGGIMKSHHIILPYIKAYVDKYAWTPWGKVEVKTPIDFDHSALLGMAHLLDDLKENKHVKIQ